MNIEYFRRIGLVKKEHLPVVKMQPKHQSDLASGHIIQLRAQQAQKIALGDKTTIKVRDGVCWLTIAGQFDDIILPTGQEWKALYEIEVLLSPLAEQTCEIEISCFV
jgi:hypothetical protein